MAPPFINWPGADGILTSNMWAWWFPNRPGPTLGPVEVQDPAEDRSPMLGQVRLRDLGQDFNAKPTPPPCSTGYLPIVDKGVVKCISASSPSGMMEVPHQQRSFAVKAYYGWREV